MFVLGQVSYVDEELSCRPVVLMTAATIAATDFLRQPDQG